MKKKKINKLLKNKEITKLVKEFKKEIKRYNKVTNESTKKFHKILEESQKNRKKFFKQLKQLKQVERWLHWGVGLKWVWWKINTILTLILKIKN